MNMPWRYPGPRESMGIITNTEYRATKRSAPSRSLPKPRSGTVPSPNGFVCGPETLSEKYWRKMESRERYVKERGCRNSVLENQYSTAIQRRRLMHCKHHVLQKMSRRTPLQGNQLHRKRKEEDNG
ncbi:hypothetical protein PABG_05521 [Paracoccidioides brasiliensis Pb03]|nr:hypothetical protein PABG_05521 [Paracoccidioides brasiliensis Pb03]